MKAKKQDISGHIIELKKQGCTLEFIQNIILEGFSERGIQSRLAYSKSQLSNILSNKQEIEESEIPLLLEILKTEIQKKSKNKLADYLRERLKNSKPNFRGQGIYEIVSERNNVEDDLSRKWLAFNPILFFRLLFPEIFPAKSYISNVFSIRPGIDVIHKKNQSVCRFTGDEKIDAKNIKGLVTLHALSRESDTIALLIDIGRFLRIKKNIFPDKRAHLVLARPDWAKVNKLNNLRGQVSDTILENALSLNFQRRRIIYGLIGIQEHKDHTDNSLIRLKAISSTDIGDENIRLKIKLMCKQFSELGSFMIDNFGDKDLLNQLESLENGNETASIQEVYKSGFEKGLVIDLLRSSKYIVFVLKTIYELYGDLGYDTFYYVFLQRYLQHEYKGFLKVAVKSEWKFENTFRKLDYFDDSFNTHYIHTLYHRNNYFSKGSSNDRVELLDVLPYTYPSGRLCTYFSSPNEQDRNVIFLDKNKFSTTEAKNIINGMDVDELAIQCCDLLCFVQELTDCNEISLDQVFIGCYNNSLINEVEISMNDFKNYKSYDIFSWRILSVWSEQCPIPFFFFPFIAALKLFDLESIQKERKLNSIEQEDYNRTDKEMRELYFTIVKFCVDYIHERTK